MNASVLLYYSVIYMNKLADEWHFKLTETPAPAIVYGQIYILINRSIQNFLIRYNFLHVLY